MNDKLKENTKNKVASASIFAAILTAGMEEDVKKKINSVKEYWEMLNSKEKAIEYVTSHAGYSKKITLDPKDRDGMYDDGERLAWIPSLDCIPKKWRKDKDVVLAAVLHDYNIYYYLDDNRLRLDSDIVEAFEQKNDPKLKDTANVVEETDNINSVSTIEHVADSEIIDADLEKYSKLESDINSDTSLSNEERLAKLQELYFDFYDYVETHKKESKRMSNNANSYEVLEPVVETLSYEDNNLEENKKMSEDFDAEPGLKPSVDELIVGYDETLEQNYNMANNPNMEPDLKPSADEPIIGYDETLEQNYNMANDPNAEPGLKPRTR